MKRAALWVCLAVICNSAACNTGAGKTVGIFDGSIPEGSDDGANPGTVKEGKGGPGAARAPGADSDTPLTDKDAAQPASEDAAADDAVADASAGVQGDRSIANGDVAGSDWRPPPGASCAGAAGAYCMDFESGSYPQGWTAITEGSGSTLTVDETRPFRGKKSLHVRMTRTSDLYSYLRSTASFNVPSEGIEPLYIRMFIYITPVVPRGFLDLIDVHARPVNPVYGNTNLLALRMVDTLFWGGVKPDNQDVLGKMHCRTPGGYCSLPTDRWTCFEAQFSTKTENVPIKLYKDGVEVKTTWNPPWPVQARVDYIRFGMIRAHGDPNRPPLDVWFDDVALSNKRIGCQ
jgi:hypothetical protein